MGHFYFVRHGQTVWNVENKICGGTDSPLTELGHAQARALGEKIAAQQLRIDEIRCSPLSRARDTAMEISTVIGIPVTQDPRLKEQNFGKWEGTVRDGDEFLAEKAKLAQDFGGGESMLRLCHRVYGLLDEITAEPDRVVLLVAHNGISRAVESYFTSMENEEFAAFGIGNCEIRRYDF